MLKQGPRSGDSSDFLFGESLRLGAFRQSRWGGREGRGEGSSVIGCFRLRFFVVGGFMSQATPHGLGLGGLGI